MSKPHEETWEVDGDGDVRRVNQKGARTSLVWLRAASGSLEANVLGSAAPEMARALLAVLKWDEDMCVRPEQASRSPMGDVRAALAKAGVLLVDTRPTLPHSGGHQP